MSGKQQTIDTKEETSAQGAESTSENKGSVNGTFDQNDEPAVILEAKTPEWVVELLESNLATQKSNQDAIDALLDFKKDVKEFKDSAAGFLTELVRQVTEKFEAINSSPESSVYEALASKFDPELDYFVSSGKQFRAPNDFNILHKEGQNVNHLGPDKLQSLLDQGLVVGLEPED